MPFTGSAQDIRLGDTSLAANPAHAQRVTLDDDTFTVEAGHPALLELHFHIAPGLHINSHSPHDETLIPTTFQLTPTDTGIRLLHTEFPPGTPFHLSGEGGAGATLSTYQNEFNLRLELAPLPRGQWNLPAKLRYQACDNASCFPAHELPMQLKVHVR